MNTNSRAGVHEVVASVMNLCSAFGRRECSPNTFLSALVPLDPNPANQFRPVTKRACNLWWPVLFMINACYSKMSCKRNEVKCRLPQCTFRMWIETGKCADPKRQSLWHMDCETRSRNTERQWTVKVPQDLSAHQLWDSDDLAKAIAIEYL